MESGRDNFPYTDPFLDQALSKSSWKLGGLQCRQAFPPQLLTHVLHGEETVDKVLIIGLSQAACRVGECHNYCSIEEWLN